MTTNTRPDREKGIQMAMTKAEFVAWAAEVEDKYDALADAQEAYAVVVAEGEGHDVALESAYNTLATAGRELYNEMDAIKTNFRDPIDGSLLYVYSATPPGGGTSVYQDGPFSFTFNEAMNPASLTNDTLQVLDEDGDPWPTTGPPTLITDGSGATQATLNLDGSLTSLGYFRLYASGSCTDANGNPMGS